jgi:hypothetical protein
MRKPLGHSHFPRSQLLGRCAMTRRNLAAKSIAYGQRNGTRGRVGGVLGLGFKFRAEDYAWFYAGLMCGPWSGYPYLNTKHLADRDRAVPDRRSRIGSSLGTAEGIGDTSRQDRGGMDQKSKYS